MAVPSAVGFCPVASDADRDVEWNRGRRDAWHDLLDDLSQCTLFIGWHFEEQFVVNLQHDPGSQGALGEGCFDAVHGQFDDVGGGALYRRVERGAFGGVNGRRILAVEAG